MKRHVKAVLSLGFFGITSLGTVLARLIGLGRPRLVVLYYHAVPARHRIEFARQLEAVCAGAEAVVPANFSGPATPGQLFVAITFDDAFTSVVKNALPELAARGMPSTIFTPSGALGRTPAWEMEEAAEDRAETVVTADVLCGLASDLVSVGAHSITHPRLPQVDRQAASAEIAGSKAQLERLLGREVTLFAFPYGEYNEDVVDLCREAGYRHAFTIVPHVVDPTDGAFLRGRVSVKPNDGSLEFWLKMRGAYAWMPWASKLKTWLLRRVSAAGMGTRTTQ